VFALAMSKSIIAFPDKSKGLVKIKSYDSDTNITITCCESALACLAFNNEGSLLATASEKVIDNVIYYWIGNSNKNS